MDPGIVTKNLGNFSKLGECEVCSSVMAKYTCPKCEVKTCSLKCSNIHKKELECDGNRDRTRFIPLKKFTNFDFNSDYRLLEEISRSVQACKKDRLAHVPHNYPRHLYKLSDAAKIRKIQLKFLPTVFKRRKYNTTSLDIKNKIIYWRIDLIFTNADNYRVTDEKVCENSKLITAVKQHISSSDDSLKYYQSVDLSGLTILLRAEQKGNAKFYELDPSLTIKENLRNKIIIEYPIIHIVLKDHAAGIDIIDETEIDVKDGEKVVNNIIEESNNEDSIYLSLKNLLFLSDNEMSD